MKVDEAREAVADELDETKRKTREEMIAAGGSLYLAKMYAEAPDLVRALLHEPELYPLRMRGTVGEEEVP